MNALSTLRALIQRNRSPGVIDFEAIKAVRARTVPGDGLQVDEVPKAIRWSMRALAYAEAAVLDGRAGAFRKAARRVHDIYRREFRHPGILMLARVLKERADVLKTRRNREAA